MSYHYGQFCPISKAAEILGERWTILIIRELLLGTSRYSDFQRALSKISPTLLTKRLTQLVDCGLVERRASPGQSRPTYHLAPAGQELQPIVFGLGEWGMKWTRGQMRDDELDVQLLMYDRCRRIDATRLPPSGAVIGFSFPGLPKFGHWWILVGPDHERELCVDHPGRVVDVQIHTSVRTLTEIWAGDSDVHAAVRAGRMQIYGNPSLLHNLAAWLRPGLTAHIRPAPNSLRLENNTTPGKNRV